MKNRKTFIILTIITLVVIIIFGINIYQKQKETSKIKIGAILPLTGELASFGEWLKEGITLAANEQNVEVSFEDNQNQVSLTLNAFQKLVNQNRVNGIITTRTPVAFALAPLVTQQKIPTVLTFADLPENTGGCLVNYHFPVKDEITLLANTMFEIGENAIILVVNDEFGNLASKIFKENFKGKIVWEDKFSPDQSDFRMIIPKLPRNASFIFLIAYEQNFVNLIKQLKQNKVQIPIVGPNVLTVFLPMVSNYIDFPMYLTSSLYGIEELDKNELYLKFSKKFEDTYRKKPNMVNVEAYEATLFLISSLSSTSNINTCENLLNTTKTMSSIFGNIKMTPDGQFHFPLAVLKLHGDKKEVIKIWQP